jgi:hypothetical protein
MIARAETVWVARGSLTGIAHLLIQDENRADRGGQAGLCNALEGMELGRPDAAHHGSFVM